MKLKQFLNLYLIEESKRINPFNDFHLEKAALKYFGETLNPFSAGYMLEDGILLDFSGGQWGGQRVLDHRDINVIFEDVDEELVKDLEYNGIKRDSNSFWMRHFMHITGAIRTGISKDFFNLDFVKRPTMAQKRKIKEIVEENKRISIDYKNKSHEFYDVWELEDFLEKI